MRTWKPKLREEMHGDAHIHKPRAAGNAMVARRPADIYVKNGSDGVYFTTTLRALTLPSA